MTPLNWFRAYAACLAAMIENLEAARLMMTDAAKEAPDAMSLAMLNVHIHRTTRHVAAMQSDLLHVQAEARMLAPMTEKDVLQ